MDNNENRTDLLPTDPNRQINLVVNHTGEEEDTIDLGKVFLNMKNRRRLFAWVLVLCLVMGVCAPLLLYQFSKPELTVTSVVTLRYEVPTAADIRAINAGRKTLKEANFEPVTDLTAPDGTKLDANQIMSSFVLQTVLDSLVLSKPITTASLRNNIGIKTLLTEESSRTRESLQGLADAKSADAYTRLEGAAMKYQNRFIVSLTNGFKEDEESRFSTNLTDAELKLLLDRILTVYNDYLVRTYADVKLPEDSFSVIDIEEQDVSDNLDQLRAGIDSLYSYCDEKTDTVKAYRSAATGRNLEDWMETLTTFKSINIDYLYSLVSEEAVTRDKTALMTSWKYQLRTAQNSLDEVNENIAETKKILKSYKNDEVYVSLQESDAAKTTKAATEYYNNLILQQAENYEKAAELKATIADYTDRITKLDAATETAVSEEIEEELKRSLASAQSLYESIRAHMEELFTSPMYTTFEDHSAAQGKLPSFLTASAKKMIIGAVVGAVLVCGVWFMAALLPEFSRNSGKDKKGSLDSLRAQGYRPFSTEKEHTGSSSGRYEPRDDNNTRDEKGTRGDSSTSVGMTKRDARDDKEDGKEAEEK